MLITIKKLFQLNHPELTGCRAHYDGMTNELIIVLPPHSELLDHGGVYLYTGVPSDVIDNWQHADSLEEYYDEHIKGTYPCAKQSDAS
jgi:hypothetical protein